MSSTRKAPDSDQADDLPWAVEAAAAVAPVGQLRSMDAGRRRKSAATFDQIHASAEAHARSEEPVAVA